MNEERLEVLQEMINIGFGRSSAAIADLLNVFVTMSVPKIYAISRNAVCNYLINQVGSCGRLSLVKQIFRGEFFGETILIFPEESGATLTNLLMNTEGESTSGLQEMQEEVLIEVGNIIIGACMGKIAELLNTMLSYNIPQIVLKSTPINQLSAQNFGNDSHILVIENALSIEDKHLKLYLFIIINEMALTWLYQTLDKNLEALYN